jgi:prolyl 4-hydroxylase
MSQVHPVLAEAFALSAAGRDVEALLIVNQLAAQGDPDGLFTLADIHWRGQVVPRNPPRAMELFRQAAEAGNAMATRAYTNLLANGTAGRRDWGASLKRLAQEARGDRRRAQMLSLIRKMDLTPDGDPRSLPQPRILSESPQVKIYPRLFSSDECDHLVEVASPNFERSMIHGIDSPDYLDPVRTSDGSAIHDLIEDPAIHALNRRLAAAAGATVEQSEPLLILRYAVGHQYRNHMDFLPGAENQRLVTGLVYLNYAYEGGETAFVRTGLKVKGGKGDAIVFVNITPDRRADPMAEHAGLPVTRGVKLLASLWMRERPFMPAG